MARHETRPLQGTSEAVAAEAIARAAHAGQADKAGRPYVEHVRRVADAVDPADVAVAWLHDVLEDTDVTAQDLAAAGISPQTIAAVEAITRRDGETSADYYRRVRANAAALRVKASDIADNASPERLAQLDDATRQRLTGKYTDARKALGIVDVPQ
ncbi:MAG: hypothetical protein QM679_11960 [Patulibacter sp.]